MMLPTDLSDVIASCEGTVEAQEAATAPIQIAIGRPFQVDPEEIGWYCTVSIRIGDEHEEIRSAAGTDGVEALTYALYLLASRISDLRSRFRILFHEEEQFTPERLLGTAIRQ